ncbi:MAG TPA: hypothetical protein VE224_04555, partial [Pseudolabrys sp.]|nr:hypothetical protein [Pseudolabrys sp.]
VDFIFYHDCLIRGLRILEVRPGVIENDELHLQPQLQALSEVGIRHSPDRRTMSFGDRMRRRILRHRRRFMAATGFMQVWGIRGRLRVAAFGLPSTTLADFLFCPAL